MLHNGSFGDSPAVGFVCPAEQIQNVFILPALLTGMEVILPLSCRDSKALQEVDLPGKRY